MKKNWKIKDCDVDKSRFRELGKELSVSTAFARILFMRGIDTKEKYERFLSDDGNIDDPFRLPDLEKAAERVVSAIKNNEKILIYGDYDADGVSSVAVMYLYLSSKGADVSYYIPSRLTEGYGISEQPIKSAAERGVRLMITVDTGITAAEEIGYALSLGIETVVTDHHECQENLPDSVANVDIKRPDTPDGICEYAGVGVAVKLCEGVEKLLCGDESVIDEYADIACIGTVADVMSLSGENRSIVKKGLEKINSGKCRPGITALIEASGKNKEVFTAKGIGFILAPRINASGRMDSADTALELLISEDPGQCRILAEELCKYNIRRQNEENQIVSEALSILRDGDYGNDRVLVIGKYGWHHGVIGIVCSRIAEKTGKPVILLSYDEDGAAKGSCRSTGSFNIVKAIESCKDLVTRFGGHDMAAGLTLPKENVAEFRKRINEYSNAEIDSAVCSELSVDMILSAREMTLPFATELEKLEPCGKDNPEPVFASLNCRVMSIVPLSGGKHTKMIVRNDGICFECIAFSFSAAAFGIETGDEISIVYSLKAKEYLGRRSVQLFMKDVCFEGKYAGWYELGEEEYSEFRNGKKTCCHVPQREDFARVYNSLRAICQASTEPVTSSYRTLSEKSGIVSYFTLRVISDIFEEAGLIVREKIGSGGGSFSIVTQTHGTKVSIEDTDTYKALLC